MPNFFGSSHASGRNFGGHACQDGLRGGACGGGFGFGQTGEAGGVGGARQHVVHGDAVDGHLGCPSFGPIATAPRMVLETPKPANGALTEVLMTFTIRPHPARCIPGKTALARIWLLMRCWLKVAKKASSAASVMGPPAGPPLLFTRMWMSPASRTSATALCTSSGRRKSATAVVSRSRQRGQCLVQPVLISREQGHGGPRDLPAAEPRQDRCLERHRTPERALAAQIQRQTCCSLMWPR